jgi:ATP-dependent Clp protease protease subunit
MEDTKEDKAFPDNPEVFLLEKRIISLPGMLDDQYSELLKNEILILDAINKEPITLYINSLGGYVESGLALYDIMNFVESPISTVCYGTAASMAAVILASGEKGMRYISPHSHTMIHQATGQISGSPEEIKLYHKKIRKSQNILSKILAKHTGKTKRQIKQDIELEKWFDAKQSVKYGLVDKVITSYKDLP